jgi:hypothetical protein
VPPGPSGIFRICSITRTPGCGKRLPNHWAIWAGAREKVHMI